jgi:hypothetical protein
MSIIIHKPHLCTKLEIWQPKYHTDSSKWEVWLHQSKVSHASSVIIVEFTKAKHLKGQRFCIARQKAEQAPVGTNGRVPVYKVPFDELEGYETAAEVRDLAFEATDGMDGIWPD